MLHLQQLSVLGRFGPVTEAALSPDASACFADSCLAWALCRRFCADDVSAQERCMGKVLFFDTCFISVWPRCGLFETLA